MIYHVCFLLQFLSNYKIGKWNIITSNIPVCIFKWTREFFYEFQYPFRRLFKYKWAKGVHGKVFVHIRAEKHERMEFIEKRNLNQMHYLNSDYFP